METGKWQPVKKAAPCGICKKPDWCSRGDKGWCCMRVEHGQRLKNGGWFHPFDELRTSSPFDLYQQTETGFPKSRGRGRHPIRQAQGFQSAARSNPIVAVSELAAPDFSALMRGWRSATSAETLTEIAQSLGVSERSLTWLGAAWAPEWNAVAFPMFDATSPTIDHPCGIRLRKRDGKKFAVSGSRNGIFIPYGALKCIHVDRIFICEGPTDTAACLDLGLFALGRPSCRGGEEFILSALSQLCPSETVVVSDNDGPGIAGADYLMDKIQGRKVKLTPPCKDMRTFVHEGGTAAVLHAMLKDLLRS